MLEPRDPLDAIARDLAWEIVSNLSTSEPGEAMDHEARILTTALRRFAATILERARMEATPPPSGYLDDDRNWKPPPSEPWDFASL